MNKQKAKKNQSSHDLFVRELLSKPKRCVELLSLALTKKERSYFDWSKLKIEPSFFINKELKEKRMDVLVSVPFKNSKKRLRVLFLLEHKSYKDPELMKQFLVYQTSIYERYKDPVIPVFINQSPYEKWPGPLEFQDYLNNFDGDVRKFFGSNVMNFRPRVINVMGTDINKLRKDLTIRSSMYIMQEVRAILRDK